MKDDVSPNTNVNAANDTSALTRQIKYEDKPKEDNEDEILEALIIGGMFGMGAGLLIGELLDD